MKYRCSASTLSLQKQRGVVLIVGLIMVLLITIVSLASIRGSGLQENMAGNMRERNVAFQAAESALREGEWLVSPSNAALPTFDGSNGNFTDLNADPQKSVLYMDEAEWSAAAKKADLGFDNVSEEPSHIVEELDTDYAACAADEGSGIDVAAVQSTGSCVPYRVTSRGIAGSSDVEIMVQTTYKRRFQ